MSTARFRLPDSFPSTDSGPRAVACGLALLTAAALVPRAAAAQGHGDQAYEPRGSDNVEVLSHLPLGPRLSVADIELEQEPGRPFAYVARMEFGEAGEKGTDVVDLSDPRAPEVVYRWRIEDAELHRGPGALDPKYFKWDGRYYLVQSLQFAQGGPNHDLGAVVFDVTGLPDGSRVEEVARIRAPETPGGFHNIFVYKHSNGRVYLFATVSGPFANVYDLGTAVEEGPEGALAARVPVPESPEGRGVLRGYHDFYVGYHPGTGTDRFYGGGTGGYYVYDVTNVPGPEEREERRAAAAEKAAAEATEEAAGEGGGVASDFELLTSLTNISGVRWGHTFTPGPNGRYAVAEAEYRYAPLRIFDLKPGLEGEVATISGPISAWTADWRNLSHNHEVRWPYVFVSAYHDGLQVFHLMDPEHPKTVAWYDTYPGPHKVGGCRSGICNGAFGVDVRNADGLIVISDMTTGFWAFRMEGFQGWSGEGWGVPDVSSAQHWDGVPGGTN